MQQQETVFFFFFYFLVWVCACVCACLCSAFQTMQYPSSPGSATPVTQHFLTCCLCWMHWGKLTPNPEPLSPPASSGYKLASWTELLLVSDPNLKVIVSHVAFIVPGLLPMCAPSLVETSTSTGSGDGLNRERGAAPSSASFAMPASIPPLRSHADDPALLAALLRRVEGWGDRLTRDEQFGDRQNPEANEEGSGPLFFLILSNFFP